MGSFLYPSFVRTGCGDIPCHFCHIGKDSRMAVVIDEMGSEDLLFAHTLKCEKAS
jgi:hypothetical protein